MSCCCSVGDSYTVLCEKQNLLLAKSFVLGSNTGKRRAILRPSNRGLDDVEEGTLAALCHVSPPLGQI